MIKFDEVKHITIEEFFNGSEFQIRTFNEKYAFTKADGSKETPAEVWWRVASELASVESTEELRNTWRDIWFSDLYEGYYRPGGSITAGVGLHKISNEKSSLSNCVTISFGGDSLDDIFTTFKRAAKNGSRRQGQGLDFSKLRPANSKVGNAARYSDGPVSWMKLFDSLANYIGQHNRRLALLFSLKVNHPDIELFLKCKDDIDSINNANISVVVDGRFIEAVENDEDWTMSFDVPEHGQTITKTIKAKKLMRMIAEHAWKTGEPGWQSHELMNKWANSPYITNKRTGKKYEIVGTNACSERPGTDNATCVLGSLNLGVLPVNWQEAKEVIKEKTSRLTRMLDNVVEYEIVHNLAPIEEQKYVLSELREIGVGFTDIQGYLIKHELAYDSSQGIELVENVAKEMCRAAYKTSEELGKEKGSFTAFTEEEFNSSLFVQRLKSECPELVMDTMRNCTIMSIAPVGSLSLTFSNPNVSSGIEPAPGFAYWKRSRSSGKWIWYFVLTSPIRKFAAENCVDLGMDVESVEDQDGVIGESVLRKLKECLGGKLSIFTPAHLIDPMKKIELMSRVSKYVDSAISTTYNLPSSATPELIERIYVEAYKKGIKAVAVYRDGCRQGVIEFDPPPVVEKRFSKNSETARPEKVERRCAPKRPKELPCEINHITVNGKKWVVLVGIYNGEPFEVFAGHSDEINIPSKLKSGKIVKNPGSKYSLVIPMDDEVLEFKDMGKLFHNDEQNALTRQISLNMRTGTHLQFIVEQLKKGAGSVADFSAAIARVLGKFSRDVVDRDKALACPSCGNTNIDRSSGCIKCPDCGWSRCE